MVLKYIKNGKKHPAIDFIFNKFQVEAVTAETDNDAIDFYKKYGFDILKTEMKLITKRYTCFYKSK